LSKDKRPSTTPSSEALGEALARLPLENPNPVLCCTADGEVLFANAAARRYAELFADDEAARSSGALAAVVARCAERDEPAEVEHRVGESILALTLRPVRDSGYVNVYGRDITGQKRAEERLLHEHADLERRVRKRTAELSRELEAHQRTEHELRLAKEAAEAGDRAKSDFLATVSHEIRTPLNGVIGMAGLLLDTDLSSEQRDFAETVRRSAESLLAIINEILDFSKLESGTLELEESVFDPVAIVESVVEFLAPRAHAKGLEITSFVAPEVPRSLLGDPGRLRQVLHGLADNAVKFTDRGSVLIEAHAEEAGDGAVRVRLDVRDTGIGIDEDELPLLFQRFQQLDASSSRRHGGAGLGLAIVKRICDLMEAEIEVRREPGGGTRFSVALPLARGAPPQSVPSTAPAGFAAKKVLVVDDTPLNCEVFVRQLGAWGLASESVANARSALESLRRAANQGRPYDAVLADYRMPETDGADLTREMKSDPSLRDTPVVMASSDSSHEARRRSRSAGVGSFLLKPVRQSILFNAMIEAIGTEESDPKAVRDAARGRSAIPRSSRRLRILVAEDNPVNQQVAQRLLMKMGHAVDVSANGVEALDSVRRLTYDAVLMDVQMPEMDGFQATAAIRALPGEVSSIPIIAMTANAMQSDRDACLAAGMDDYIAKPVDARKLANVLDTWIERMADDEGASS